MDGRSNKGQDLTKAPAECLSKSNKSLPRGLLYREIGLKQKQNSISKEFQQAAEDSLVVKNHEELVCFYSSLQPKKRVNLKLHASDVN